MLHIEKVVPWKKKTNNAQAVGNTQRIGWPNFFEPSPQKKKRTFLNRTTPVSFINFSTKTNVPTDVFRCG